MVPGLFYSCISPAFLTAINFLKLLKPFIRHTPAKTIDGFAPTSLQQTGNIVLSKITILMVKTVNTAMPMPAIKFSAAITSSSPSPLPMTDPATHENSPDVIINM